MERDTAVRLHHWSNRFIYMYGSTLYSPIPLSKQTKSLRNSGTSDGKFAFELFNCVYSFDEIQFLWCFPAKDGSRGALCHVGSLVTLTLSLPCRFSGLLDIYGYTLTFVFSSWGFSFRPSKSFFLKMLTLAPESAIMRIGVSIILTWNIGLAVWGSLNYLPFYFKIGICELALHASTWRRV